MIFRARLIGGQVAPILGAAGHDVVALGRSAGVDTTTGEGVAEAVRHADVAVDVTS